VFFIIIFKRTSSMTSPEAARLSLNMLRGNPGAPPAASHGGPGCLAPLCSAPVLPYSACSRYAIGTPGEPTRKEGQKGLSLGGSSCGAPGPDWGWG